MRSKAIKVLCVDDHFVVIDGMKAAIQATSDLEFVGSLGSAEGVVEEVARTGADIVLLDIEMPGPDPFEVAEDLSCRCQDARVVVFSAYVRDHYIDAAVSVGAWGYLSKNDEVESIIDAIRRVAAGEFVFGPSVASRCTIKRRSSNNHNGFSSKLQSLTAREQQILRMIGKGMSRAEIAKVLHRSPKTVDSHRAEIMRKLDIHDRTELILYAVREGLVEA